jgi:hypothetical protein
MKPPPRTLVGCRRRVSSTGTAMGHGCLHDSATGLARRAGKLLPGARAPGTTVSLKEIASGLGPFPCSRCYVRASFSSRFFMHGSFGSFVYDGSVLCSLIIFFFFFLVLFFLFTFFLLFILFSFIFHACTTLLFSSFSLAYSSFFSAF